MVSFKCLVPFSPLSFPFLCSKIEKSCRLSRVEGGKEDEGRLVMMDLMNYCILNGIFLPFFPKCLQRRHLKAQFPMNTKHNERFIADAKKQQLQN